MDQNQPAPVPEEGLSLFPILRADFYFGSSIIFLNIFSLILNLLYLYNYLFIRSRYI